MVRNQLTERYLEQLRQGGPAGGELADTAQRSFDLAAASYEGRCLSRPVFLDHPEWAQLTADLEHLHLALAGLPDRVFGGDFAGFARASGLTEPQVAAVQRGRGKSPTRLARADLYHDGAGFRLMELNMGSAVGGLDTAMLNRALLTHPMIAQFVEANRLTFVDTLAQVVETIRAECQVPEGTRPVMAAVDWPASFATLEPQLRHSAAALAPLGIDAIPCHLGQLRFAEGRVWVEDRPIDVIYRLFMLEDVLDTEGPALMEPVLRAVEAGEVAIFTPLDAELYGSKSSLAMLSDEANRGRHDPAVLASLDRLLPWTRMLRDELVTVGNERVGLKEYALAHREELVLKPTSRHGGSGVVLGWLVDDAQWRAQLTEAMGQPFVLQRRIHAVPEPFPTAERTDWQPWLLRWGVFTVSNGYGGATVVGSTAITGDVVNMNQGGTAGCCFHAPHPPS